MSDIERIVNLPKDFICGALNETGKDAHEFSDKIRDRTPSEIIKKVSLGVGTALAITTLVFSVNLASGEASAVGSYDTATPTHTPTATPVPTATPNAVATRIAETKETLKELQELQNALDALRHPTPAPVPPSGVVVVPQDVEVVKPEVVKPEIVKVPGDPIFIPVPVTPVPDPAFLRIPREDYNKLVEELRENKKLAADREKELMAGKAELEAARKAEEQARVSATVAVQGKVDWWWVPLSAAAALGAGVFIFTRHTVIEQIHHHGPPGVPHTHPHP